MVEAHSGEDRRIDVFWRADENIGDELPISAPHNQTRGRDRVLRHFARRCAYVPRTADNRGSAVSHKCHGHKEHHTSISIEYTKVIGEEVVRLCDPHPRCTRMETPTLPPEKQQGCRAAGRNTVGS